MAKTSPALDPHLIDPYNIQSQEEIDVLIDAFKNDPGFYASKVLKILTKNEGLITCRLTSIQKQLLAWYNEDVAANKPIRWKALKPRQHGFSTFDGIIINHRQMFKSPRNALIIADREESSGNLFAMQQLFHKHLPPWLAPIPKYNNRNILYFDEIEARTRVATAGNEDAGSSFTTHDLICSEVARWDRRVNVKKLLSSLLPSVPDGPNSLIIYETTAGEAEGGWFKEKYENTEDGFRKIFIPFCAHEEYRLQLEQHDYFQLSTSTSEQYGNEEDLWDLCEKELMIWNPEFDYDDPEIRQKLARWIYCCLAWRRKKLREDFDFDIRSFQRNYPLSEEEAFSSSGEAVFDRPALDAWMKLIRSPAAIRPVRLRFDDKLVALRESNESWWSSAWIPDIYGPLHIYHTPETNAKYVIGADPSEGVEHSDECAMVVLKVPELIECAVWNLSIDGDTFGDIVYSMALFYNNALVGMESNAGYGVPPIKRLIKFHNYRHLSSYEYFNAKKYSKATKYGWLSNDSTKSEMVTALRTFIKNGQLQLNHLETIRQLRWYSKIVNKSAQGWKYGAPPRKKDDLVTALGIAVQLAITIHVHEERMEKSTEGTFAYWASKIPKSSGSLAVKPNFEVAKW